MMSKLAICACLLQLAPCAKLQVPAQARGNKRRPGYSLRFPRDHASHPDYKIEWWYYTGNVKAADGRRFGYQVTFFRVGIDHAPANPSKWAVRDLFMTHLAVSDAKGQRYRYAEKLSRGGPGPRRREARSLPRLERRLDGRDQGSGIGDQGTRAASARSPQAGIDLVLDEGKPPAINGINGISQKGAQAGNASHYYSLTRMPTNGTIDDRRRDASRSPARAGWITNSAPASSSPSSAAGTGCRSSSPTTAS